MPLRQNPRGWDIYDEFKDVYGVRVRIQESSSAEERRVWLFTAPDAGSASALHLNREGVDRLIAALQEWKGAQET